MKCNMVVLDGSTGKPRWQIPMREAGRREIAGIAYTPAGDLIVAARAATSKARTRLVVTAYKDRGKIAWRTESRDEGSLVALGLTLAPSGDIVISGSLHGTTRIGTTKLSAHDEPGSDPRADTDPALIVLAPTGAVRWTRVWQASGDASVRAAAYRGDELWIVGTFRRDVDLGEKLETSASEGSFVARIDARGEVAQVEALREPTFTAATSIFADGHDLVIGGDLLEEVTLPGSTSRALDEDAWAIRWDGTGKLPRLRQLANPSKLDTKTETDANIGASYGGASYGGASYGGASYGGASYGGASYERF